MGKTIIGNLNVVSFIVLGVVRLPWCQAMMVVQQVDKSISHSHLLCCVNLLLEGYPFLRVSSHLTFIHPLRIPFSPNRGYFLLPFLYLVFFLTYLDSSCFFLSISFLFSRASFYMNVPINLGCTIISS